jgi:hypothetical protein
VLSGPPQCLAFAMAELSLPGLWRGTDERERLAMQLKGVA